MSWVLHVTAFESRAHSWIAKLAPEVVKENLHPRHFCRVLLKEYENKCRAKKKTDIAEGGNVIYIYIIFLNIQFVLFFIEFICYILRNFLYWHCTKKVFAIIPTSPLLIVVGIWKSSGLSILNRRSVYPCFAIDLLCIDLH